MAKSLGKSESIQNNLLLAIERLKSGNDIQANSPELAEILKLIENCRQELSAINENEPFDLETYTQKIQRLLAYSQEILIEALKDLPRDSQIMVQKTFMKRKDGKYFKMAIFKITSKTTGKSWEQILIIQEFAQLDKHSANMEIGQEILPVRLNNQHLEVGITVKNPLGALGVAVFYCPGGSLNRPDPSIFQKWPDEATLKTDLIRRDANRISGMIKTGIALVNKEDEPKIDLNYEKLVWFTIPELKKLQTEPQFCDAVTKYLAEWVINNQAQILEKLYPPL